MLVRWVDYSNCRCTLLYCQIGNWSEVQLMKNRTWDRWRTHCCIAQIHWLLGVNHMQVVLLPAWSHSHAQGKSDTLSNQVILVMSHFHESANKAVEMAAPDDEVDGLLSPKEERERDEAEKERHTYLSLHHLSHLMELWRKPNPSLVLSVYIYMGGRQSFQVMSWR